MRHVALVLGLAGLVAAGISFAETSKDVPVPPPRIDAHSKPGLETAVLAGGCFWGMEGVFEHVKGVKSVTAGYAGGARAAANYGAVSSEKTGHAEAVKIVFDPREVSYGTLLRIYFSVAHDPTELNRQGPDSGPSYRSAIFPIGPEQAKIARTYIAQLSAAHAFPRPIVTRIESGPFFPAEAYHQNYFDRHPSDPYIRINDVPKVAALKAAYPKLWQAKSAG